MCREHEKVIHIYNLYLIPLAQVSSPSSAQSNIKKGKWNLDSGLSIKSHEPPPDLSLTTSPLSSPF